MQALLKSFADMAKANQDLVAKFTSTDADNAPTGNTATDLPGAVALTGIKIPLDMGRDAEERLVNFHEWKEDVADRMTVAGIVDEVRKTTIALMWGGRDLKTFAVEKANVQMKAIGATPADGWTEALKKIETTMEGDINEAFAMFKFRQGAQQQQSIEVWYKKLKSAVKTLRLKECTCGHGYSEERAIRDIMVELTNDTKLRKDALSKDLSLAALLKEGEANELARSRAATVEGKSVNKIDTFDDELTDEEANYMIAKLKRAGKYSARSEKLNNGVKNPCTRCTKPRQQHTQDKCYFKDKSCNACQQIGHMKGSQMCPKTEAPTVKRVSIGEDYDDPLNWEVESSTTESRRNGGTIRAVGKKNVVAVKVGECEDTEMYTDSGADVSIVPRSWYRSGMGKLQPSDQRLTGYGSTVPLTVIAKFWTTITTKKGACVWAEVFVVDDSEIAIQPLLGDPEATELGFITFKPEGREPRPDEQQVNRISDRVVIGQGPMPDVKDIPEITEEEAEECWNIVNDPKYDTIFDGHIGTMIHRKPISG